MKKSFKYLLNNLPIELIEIILKLTYKPQNPLLLEDIRNFTSSKELLLSEYAFGIHPHQENNLNWISNDLFMYCNAYNLNKYLRLFMIDNQFMAIDYAKCLLKKSPIARINTIWGLLTATERSEMMDSSYLLIIFI